jgi:hypothetical protein
VLRTAALRMRRASRGDKSYLHNEIDLEIVRQLFEKVGTSRKWRRMVRGVGRRKSEDLEFIRKMTAK